MPFVFPWLVSEFPNNVLADNKASAESSLWEMCCLTMRSRRRRRMAVEPFDYEVFGAVRTAFNGSEWHRSTSEIPSSFAIMIIHPHFPLSLSVAIRRSASSRQAQDVR